MNSYAIQRELGDADPVDVLDRGWDYPELARQLWSLVDEKRTRALGELMARVQRRDLGEVRFVRADLDEAVRLVSGLKAALIGTIIDTTWVLPSDTGSVRRVAEPRLRPPRGRAAPVERRHAGDRVHLSALGSP
jgi:hypothetical protein